jgi:hypothetical protein
MRSAGGEAPPFGKRIAHPAAARRAQADSKPSNTFTAFWPKASTA